MARYNLGRAHVARGEWEQARQSFQKAIELHPDYMLARLALAQLLVTRGDFDAALKAAADILRIDHTNKYAQLIESAALLGEKKYDESRALLNAMLQKTPDAPDVLFQLGVVNLAQGKYKEANESFKRTYELNPANSRGLMGMVETDMAENKSDEAIKVLEAEAAKAPNSLGYSVGPGQYGSARRTLGSGAWIFPARSRWSGQELEGARRRLHAHRRDLSAKGRFGEFHQRASGRAQVPAGQRAHPEHAGCGVGRRRPL